MLKILNRKGLNMYSACRSQSMDSQSMEVACAPAAQRKAHDHGGNPPNLRILPQIGKGQTTLSYYF